MGEGGREGNINQVYSAPDVIKHKHANKKQQKKKDGTK